MPVIIMANFQEHGKTTRPSQKVEMPMGDQLPPSSFFRMIRAFLPDGQSVLPMMFSVISGLFSPRVRSVLSPELIMR